MIKGFVNEYPVTVRIEDLWVHKSSQREMGWCELLVGLMEVERLIRGTAKHRFLARDEPRYLSAERLAGLEKSAIWGSTVPCTEDRCRSVQQYKNYGNETGTRADAFVILKRRIDSASASKLFLSTIFGRRNQFAEEGGFLKRRFRKFWAQSMNEEVNATIRN